MQHGMFKNESQTSLGLSTFQYFTQMKKNFTIIFILFAFNINAKGYNKKVPKIKFSGFIKYELFADTRQTVNAREGLVPLYPANILHDGNGNDVNASNSFNMLSIHSRVGFSISGPMLLGAESAGLMEADFYGNENENFSDLNGLRLFNAYMTLNWGTTELLTGQFWHPMSIPGFFPSTVSFNTGAPFHPMARNPQIRLVQLIGRFKFIGCLFSQRDFTGTGPDGPGSQYLRNSGIPNIHFQVQCGADSSKFTVGAGIDYKKIVPELYTVNDESKIFSTQNSLVGMSYMAFLRLKTSISTLKMQAVYSQNAYDILMLGGYATKKITNIQTGEKVFSNLNTASIWSDFQTNGEKFHAGLFCGYSKNMGSGEEIEGSSYARGADIDNLYRISPRIVYTTGPLAISLEGEYTTVYYGEENGNMKGGVTDTYPVSNLRTSLSVKYSF